jgi:hypothetical protein
MQRESQETWAKRVERWKEGGLTAEQYASELGINPRSLRWWRWRLTSGAQDGGRVRREKQASTTATGKATTTPKRGPTLAVPPMTFVEMSAGFGTDALEVVLGTNVRIRVRPDFDAATLTRLLDVLEPRR